METRLAAGWVETESWRGGAKRMLNWAEVADGNSAAVKERVRALAALSMMRAGNAAVPLESVVAVVTVPFAKVPWARVAVTSTPGTGWPEEESTRTEGAGSMGRPAMDWRGWAEISKLAGVGGGVGVGSGVETGVGVGSGKLLAAGVGVGVGELFSAGAGSGAVGFEQAERKRVDETSKRTRTGCMVGGV